jgi:hypothetical protein
MGVDAVGQPKCVDGRAQRAVVAAQERVGGAGVAALGGAGKTGVGDGGAGGGVGSCATATATTTSSAASVSTT